MKPENNTENKVYSDDSIRMAIEILQTDIRINDARLSDAIDHGDGLLVLYEIVNEKVLFLRKKRLDLQAKLDSISLKSHPVIGVNCDIHGEPFSVTNAEVCQPEGAKKAMYTKETYEL